MYHAYAVRLPCPGVRLYMYSSARAAGEAESLRGQEREGYHGCELMTVRRCGIVAVVVVCCLVQLYYGLLL